MATTARIDELQKKFEESPRRYFAPLANEYRKAGDIQQAIDICRAYLPQQPGHMSGHIVYGQALYEARQFEESRAVFETALSLDPENLIALRHLGDIALITGDSAAARGWYSRVLEADPRNEEIQAQLATIDQTPAVEATPAPPPEATDPATSVPTPVSARAVEQPAVAQPAAALPSSAPTIVVSAQHVASAPAAESTFAPPPSPEPPPLPPPAPAETPPPPTIELDSAVAGAAAASPTSSSALEGLESTSFTPPSAAESPRMMDAVVAAADVIEPPPAIETAPHVETEAPPPLPELELAPVPPPTADLPMLDVSEKEPAAAAESGPFITETMAELYLQQGHREEALRVYRALLEQRPDDMTLRAKLRVLEMPASAPPAAARSAQRPVVTQQPQTSSLSRPGPFMPPPLRRERAPSTIRELLSVVALRRPGFRPTSTFAVPSQPMPLTSQPIVVQPQATQIQSAYAPAPSGQPPSGNGAPVAAETPKPTPRVNGDAMASLFGNGRVLAADENAAMTLAAAFSAGNGSSTTQATQQEARELTGAPARPAANELSLDTVFGAAQPAPPAPATFSFDQFFSKRATAEHPTNMDAPNSPTTEAQNDVAKFTQWLEGLKQR